MFNHVTYINKRTSLPVSIVVSGFEVRGGFVDIDGIVTIMAYIRSFHNHISHIIIKYKKYHWLSIFMLCKLQHGKIEIIWYLQFSKAWQVVECTCLDWCNLSRMQLTTKYKIRTKYNDNLSPKEYKESR